MRETFLPFSPPTIGPEEIEEVVATLRSDWITTGPRVARFEEDFRAYLGCDSALGLSSGTAAMHVGLLALGIGAGDLVITTPMTFCSTAHVIEHVGARPIFIDIEPDTLNIDLERVEAFLDVQDARRPVRAMLPVHLYGHPCELDRLDAVALAHDLVVVEDAAHALPARYQGRLVGTAPPPSSPLRLTAFSFYATKNLTTGEGGMLTGPADLMDKARSWSLHGMDRDAWKRYGPEGSWYYEVVAAGFKYNLTDISAALGLRQLAKLPVFHERRKSIATRYNEAFAELPEVQIPVERPGVAHAWHIYALRLLPERLRISRDDFIAALSKRNIGASVHFIPLHLQPYYRDRYGLDPAAFPVADREYRRLVSLPIYPRMTDTDVEEVIEAVGGIVSENRS